MYMAMIEAIVSFFKTLLSNANANIRCYFNSSCCNRANASEPRMKKIARILERWNKKTKRSDVEKAKTPWQRYKTI